MATRFTPVNFIVRLIAAIALVCASYNPLKPYSYYEWAIAPALTDLGAITPIHGLVGVIILIGWVIFLRATARSLGFFGILLAAAFFAMLIWVMIDQGWVSLEANNVLSWIIIFAISAILATGLSWSHIRRRMSGQLDVDETDDG